jgi:glycosyltransferase involved in cell wall biosynthesis
VGVLVSRSEGFGNVAAEYGLMGKPSVVSDCGGLPEIVEDGSTGFVVPRGDSRTLADRMILLMEDPAAAARMGNAARERVRALFSLERWVDAMYGHYREVASGDRI